LFGDVYAGNNGDLSILRHNPKQYSVTTHNLIVKAQQTLDKYKS
jgi:hypothetical protein